MTLDQPVLEFTQVAGIPFINARPVEATDWIVGAAKRRLPIPVRFMNAWSVVCAHDDDAYLREVIRFGVNFPDGKPLPIVAKIRAAGKLSQVRGPNAFRSVLDRGRPAGIRHMFLGASDETLRSLVARVEEEYPGVEVAGCYAPPYAPIDEKFVQACVAAIRASDPDLIWVALGTPKQDRLALAIAEETQRMSLAVGAAFDFVAGTVREAPRWVQMIGFEWSYRLLAEPRRLWRRYLIGNFRFLWLAFSR